jgi:hypothetical protein
MLIVAQSAFGITNTVITDNGDWSLPGTWSLGRIPVTGDIVIIPGGMTLQITTNIYNSPPQPVITINVFGILLMTSTGQLNLGAGSVMYVIGNGTMPSTGCNCNQLNFDGGNAEWKGKDDGLTGGSCLPGPCVPLKVKMTSFYGESSNKKAILKWSTVNEDHMDHYEIQKSTDGINFEDRGLVKAEGKMENNYSFTDNNLSEKTAYYRLKEVEQDNTMTYSAIIALRTKETPAFSLDIYPNPANSPNSLRVHFNTSGEKEEVMLVLEDIMGKNYFSKVLIVETDSDYSIENTQNLNPGIYLVVASSNNKFYSQRVLIR